jgi:muramoyltetrapeptide carboxypeptidase
LSIEQLSNFERMIPYLKQGSVIGITCPASYVSLQQIEYAAGILSSYGFSIRLGKTCGTQHFYFSGDDDARLNDLQEMMDDPGINAILMGRGGYGMSRIIDRLDLTKFQQRPKWICGFSDIVVLLNHLQANYNMPSLHSPMCNAYKPETLNAPHLKSFLDAITGQPLVYNIPPSPHNRPGTAQGILTGGNLAILAHLTGSASEVDTSGKILFIEDISEYLYNADRLLLNLKRAGKLDKLQALIVGGFTDMQDTERPFGQTIEEIIFDKVKEYDYPVCFNFPCGHQEINYTLTIGMEHRLNVNAQGVVLEKV